MARSRVWRTLRVARIVLAALALAATTLAFGYAADLVALLAHWWEGAPLPEETEGLALVAQANLGPALMAAAARLSCFGVAAVAAILAATALLGRAYCAVVCPLGILQDVLGMLFFWRRNRPQPRLLLLRKGLGVAVWAVALVGGWTIGLRFLDPFTVYGAIAAGAWLPLLLIALLTLWRRRVFCNSLCPVGALLACGSAMAPLGLRLTDKCVKCGKCAAECPVGAIPAAGGGKEPVIVRTGAKVCEGAAYLGFLHRVEPEAQRGFCAAREFIEIAIYELTLASGVAGVYDL